MKKFYTKFYTLLIALAFIFISSTETVLFCQGDEPADVNAADANAADAPVADAPVADVPETPVSEPGAQDPEENFGDFMAALQNNLPPGMPLPGMFGGVDMEALENTQDLITPDTLTGRRAWLYLKDTLLLVPGYTKAFLAAPAGFMGAWGGWKAASTIIETEKFQEHTADRIFKTGTLRHELLFPIIKAATMLLATVGVWKLAHWGIDRVLHWYAVIGFLRDWQTTHRAKTPLEVREFFDKEHENFLKGGKTYAWSNTKRIISIVKAGVHLTEQKIACKMPVTPELEQEEPVPAQPESAQSEPELEPVPAQPEEEIEEVSESKNTRIKFRSVPEEDVPEEE